MKHIANNIHGRDKPITRMNIGTKHRNSHTIDPDTSLNIQSPWQPPLTPFFGIPIEHTEAAQNPQQSYAHTVD